MSSLDAFFQINEMTADSQFSIGHLSQTPKETDYQQVHKQLFELAVNDETDMQQDQNEEHQDPELSDITRHTKQGFERLKQELESFTKLKRKMDDLTHDIDNIYKTRNDIIHGLRQMSLDPEHKDKIQHVEKEIEELVQNIIAFKETEKTTCLSNLKKTKKILQVLQDVFCVHKWCKSYHVCPVCLTNEVSIYINPCGHTFCQTCMNREYCDLCRRKVISKGKLYI